MREVHFNLSCGKRVTELFKDTRSCHRPWIVKFFGRRNKWTGEAKVHIQRFRTRREAVLAMNVEVPEKLITEKDSRLIKIFSLRKPRPRRCSWDAFFYGKPGPNSDKQECFAESFNNKEEALMTLSEINIADVQKRIKQDKRNLGSWFMW